MHLAVLSGNLAHVMILIDQGADFDKQDSQGQTPLYIAAQKGFQGIVNLLMICGANPDLKTSFNALKPEDAANEEIRACIQKLHAIRKTTPKDSTPLHIAVRAGYPLALRLLVRHFDVNKKNSLGKTALNLAMEAGNQEMSRILLEHGAESG